MKFIALTLALLATATATATAETATGKPSNITNGPVTFSTTESNIRRPAGALEGTLIVTIANGSIVGYFRPADSGGRKIDVTGSLTGDKIFLQIGDELPLTGVYRDGEIEAYRSKIGDPYLFTAVPVQAST